MYNYYEDISVLLGKTLIDVNKTGNSITFITSEGESYLMYHEQDCCESVDIEDIDGDLDDLKDSPITLAEKSTSDENPKTKYDDSFTWTFYRLATVKGYVNIRWYGSSNGYYSESVSFIKLKNN